MFDNIGGKIKALAKVVCWVGIIVFCLIGLIIMAAGQSAGAISIGVLTAGIGSLLSWVGSFFTYGFGQLIENSDKLVKAMVVSNDSENTTKVICATNSEAQKELDSNDLPGDTLKSKKYYDKFYPNANDSGHVGNNAYFYYFSEKSEIYIAGTGDVWTYSCLKEILGVFASKSIKYVKLMAGITSAGKLFAGLQNLESVSIPSSVESIFPEAFSNCPNLKTIYSKSGTSAEKVANELNGVTFIPTEE